MSAFVIDVEFMLNYRWRRVTGVPGVALALIDLLHLLGLAVVPHSLEADPFLPLTLVHLLLCGIIPHPDDCPPHLVNQQLLQGPVHLHLGD